MTNQVLLFGQGAKHLRIWFFVQFEFFQLEESSTKHLHQLLSFFPRKATFDLNYFLLLKYTISSPSRIYLKNSDFDRVADSEINSSVIIQHYPATKKSNYRKLQPARRYSTNPDITD